jgi:hypothetical protein
MSCVLMYNAIGREVAAEVGAKVVDLYGYVEDFCNQGTPNGHGGGPLLPPDSGFGNNYTACAIQSSGLHFFTSAPQPSGQQYTGFHIAAEASKMILNAHINNHSQAAAAGGAASLTLESSSSSSSGIAPSCGAPPAPLSATLPNVLIIGDSISEQYSPSVERLLLRPGRPWRNASGALAAVQHNGNTGSNQAGPTANGVACISSWLGQAKWDVITINFVSAMTHCVFQSKLRSTQPCYCIVCRAFMTAAGQRRT